jgi:ClpP class serine protease
MSKIPHILEKVFHEPWLITVGGFSTVNLVIESKLAGIDTSKYEAEAEQKDAAGTWIQATMDHERIATIPITGVLGQRLSGIEKICGGTDYLDIQKATEEMLGRGAQGIIYAFDSSGGMVRGCADLASYIGNLPVPTQAFTDSKCNSAAYWLAAACDGVMATKSADVGSIGVILPWVDRSKVWDMEGLKHEPFTNEGADLKGTGSGPALSSTQREYLQDQVNFVGEQFQAHVKEHRPKIDKEVFRAGTYFGEQALKMGLIDEVGLMKAAHTSLLTRVKNKKLVPEPVSKSRIQGKNMTKEELQAQHPELYSQMVQDAEKASATAAQEAAKTAANAAMAAERNRLAGLDALSFTPECRAIVEKAKADGRDATAIGLEISGLLAKENEHLRLQIGVYKGAAPTSFVASVDPNSVEHRNDDQARSKRLADAFAKRMGKPISASGGKN